MRFVFRCHRRRLNHPKCFLQPFALQKTRTHHSDFEFRKFDGHNLILMLWLFVISYNLLFRARHTHSLSFLDVLHCRYSIRHCLSITSVWTCFVQVLSEYATFHNKIQIKSVSSWLQHNNTCTVCPNDATSHLVNFFNFQFSFRTLSCARVNTEFSTFIGGLNKYPLLRVSCVLDCIDSVNLLRARNSFVRNFNFIILIIWFAMCKMILWRIFFDLFNPKENGLLTRIRYRWKTMTELGREIQSL